MSEVRLIDAEALKEKLNKKALDLANGGMIFIESINHIIDNAPTVESDKELKGKIETYKNAYRIMSDAFENEVKKNQRPQGEWNYIQAGMCVCPFCGAYPHKDYKNYCPNCGADMRGKDDQLRDCENCVHHSENGCEVWECEFEKRSDV